MFCDSVLMLADFKPTDDWFVFIDFMIYSFHTGERDTKKQHQQTLWKLLTLAKKKLQIKDHMINDCQLQNKPKTVLVWNICALIMIFENVTFKGERLFFRLNSVNFVIDLNYMRK